jgi:hypothetical protein
LVSNARLKFSLGFALCPRFLQLKQQKTKKFRAQLLITYAALFYPSGNWVFFFFSKSLFIYLNFVFSPLIFSRWNLRAQYLAKPLSSKTSLFTAFNLIPESLP